MFQQPCHACVDRCFGRHLWLRLSCPLSMMRNRRLAAPNAKHFDEAKRVNGPKNQGRHQGPTALGDRGWWALNLSKGRTTSPPCRPGPRPYPVGLWQTNIEALLQQALRDTSFLQRLQNRIFSFWYMATISHKKTVHLNRQTVRLTIIWKPHKSYKSIEP